VKNTISYLLLVLSLSLIGCNQTNVQPEIIHIDRVNKWQPILLKDGNNFVYQIKDQGNKLTVVRLVVKQDIKNNLHALWNIEIEDKVIISKQVIDSPERLFISSKAALLPEKTALPFLNTILMNWWTKIDYFYWRVGYKRAVLVEMLAGFMIEVISECEVAGINGFTVQLRAGITLMAEACLSPTMTFPLSVIRYNSDTQTIKYEATLLEN